MVKSGRIVIYFCVHVWAVCSTAMLHIAISYVANILTDIIGLGELLRQYVHLRCLRLLHGMLLHSFTAYVDAYCVGLCCCWSMHIGVPIILYEVAAYDDLSLASLRTLRAAEAVVVCLVALCSLLALASGRGSTFMSAVHVLIPLCCLSLFLHYWRLIVWDCAAAHRFRQAGMIMRVILFWLGAVFVMHGLCTLGYLLFWNELAAGHEVSLAMVHPLQVAEAVIDVWGHSLPFLQMLDLCETQGQSFMSGGRCVAFITPTEAGGEALQAIRFVVVCMCVAHSNLSPPT